MVHLTKGKTGLCYTPLDLCQDLFFDSLPHLSPYRAESCDTATVLREQEQKQSCDIQKISFQHPVTWPLGIKSLGLWSAAEQNISGGENYRVL